MPIDFTFIKDINFANSDNLLFFSVISIVAIILVSVVLFIIFEILKSITNFLKSLLPKSEKRPEINNQNAADEAQKNVPQDFFVSPMPAKKDDNVQVQKTAEQTEKEKQGKNIESQLGKLKSEKTEGAPDEKILKTGAQNDDRIIINTAEKTLASSENMGNIPALKNYAEKSAAQKNEAIQASNIHAEPNVISKNNETPIGQKPQVIENRDSTIFAGKDKIPMREAVYDIVKKTTSGYSRVGGQSYSRQERAEIAKKISDVKKFGTILQKSEKGRIYRTLRKERIAASPSGRMKIDKQVRFLNKVIGK